MTEATTRVHRPTRQVTERVPAHHRDKEQSSPTRILSGLLLARDRRSEFVQLEDGSWMVPSRSHPTRRHKVTSDSCGCEDHEYGGWRCAHLVAVLALEVARTECRGVGFEHDMRVGAVLDLMLRIRRPAPIWASRRWVEVEAQRMADEAASLVGVSEALRDMIRLLALDRRDLAWEVRL